MKGSPDVFPGFDFDNKDSNNPEFDPHTDFAQFLEEARVYSNNMEVLEGENGKKLPEQLNQEKKQSKKKSWKLTALFSLWKKTEKKTNQCPKKASGDPHSWKPRHPTHVSGPVKGTEAGAAVTSKQHRRPASGPLIGLFDSKRKEGTSEIPYVSLNKLTKPQYDAKVYGPVYLVS
ncbi:hypothetical protein Cgig2_031154 [Carnegiea gigantea]|uniref:Uncharacterized protein n=1 Tax=Carnegiea gigantea TaxID=171969 RepID=A0A9Q1QN20_9CARY|nr:hypothetical protein Cgig2_031154 [Carnegiea gigantea]